MFCIVCGLDFTDPASEEPMFSCYGEDIYNNRLDSNYYNIK